MDLDDAVERLYAGSPDDFVATRTELVRAARAAKDRELATRVAALRKPAAPAAALNRWARTDPDGVTALIDLGERLRAAQSRLDGPALAALRPEREDLLTRLVRTAGEGLGAAAAAQVRASLVAALADEQAARAVTSGALVQPLEYTGFGEVVVDEAVAAGRLRLVPPLPSSPPEPPTQAGPDPAQDADPAQDGGPDDAAAEAARELEAERARAALARAEDLARRCAEDRAAADDVRREREADLARAEQDLAVLQERLDLARRRVASAGARAQDARERSEQARRSQQEADRALGHARAALDHLTAGESRVGRRGGAH